MKMTFSHQAKKGFTLIELLVVIAILGALAGVGIPTVLSMIERSNVTAANKVCKDLVAGVQAFKDDHGVLPYNEEKIDDSESEVIVLTTDGENDADLVHILFNTEIGKDFNTEGRPYIKTDSVEDPTGGLYENGDVAGLYDPWGSPYYVFMRTSAEGSLTDPFTNTLLRNQYCIAYSTGTDRVGKHHDLDAPKAKSTKKGKNKKKKKSKDEEDVSDEPLRYPDYTAAEQEQIADNVYSWKKTED